MFSRIPQSWLKEFSQRPKKRRSGIRPAHRIPSDRSLRVSSRAAFGRPPVADR